jgi:hypothetical protein
MGDGDLDGMRRRLDDHNHAIQQLKQAEHLLQTALSTPGEPGVELACSRVARAQKRLIHTTAVLTRGRALDQVMWTLPDEL